MFDMAGISKGEHAPTSRQAGNMYNQDAVQTAMDFVWKHLSSKYEEECEIDTDRETEEVNEIFDLEDQGQTQPTVALKTIDTFAVQAEKMAKASPWQTVRWHLNADRRDRGFAYQV